MENYAPLIEQFKIGDTPVQLSEITKTVADVLNMDVGEEVKEELRKHPADWLVLLNGNQLMVAPPQVHTESGGWQLTDKKEKPVYDSCCENEDRGWDGGCKNCGDPCL